MARTKVVQTDKPKEIQELEEQLKEKKREYKRKSLLESAQATIDSLESQYEDAKRIFFAVNGARRILKNQ